MNNIDLKADLLCIGMSADNATLELFEEQNPNEVWKTGNNGCFFEFDSTRLMASIVHQINGTSPYHFLLNEKHLLKGNEIVRKNVNATIYPDWYRVKLSTGRAFTEVFLLEGERFFHQAYKGCDYMANGVGCGFCSTGYRNNRESTPVEIGEAAGIIKEYMSAAQICLDGGTYLPISNNVNYFIECVKQIRKRNESIPIWIEIVPPSQEDVLRLIDVGATSFGFNIEIWDDKKRKEMCPGKSEISMYHYLDILQFAAKQLPDKIGSCLIVGLDKPNNVREGVRALIDIGVHPCILPFKPFDGSRLEKAAPCNPVEYIELSDYAVNQMQKNGLNLLANEGCLLCECCTVMHDMWPKIY